MDSSDMPNYGESEESKLRPLEWVTMISMQKDEREKLTEAEVLETETTSPQPDIVEETIKQGRFFASLRHREYRYLWSGALLSNTGTWIQYVALGWFVLQLTNSTFALGFVNFASTLPTFFLALVGGVIADRYERRSLLITTQVLLSLLALTLGILITLNAASISNIVIISLISGIATSFGFPAWLALIPELVPRKDLVNAVALNAAQFNAARLIGPAIAGLIVGLYGVAASFYVNALSFLAVIVALVLIKPRPVAQPGKTGTAWQHFIGGIEYARSHLSTSILLISAGVISVFGTSYTVLMPVFARDILNAGPQGLGYLMAASGFGALSGALLIAKLSHMIRKSDFIKIGMLSFGLFLIIFAFSRDFTLSLIAQIGIGASFLASASTINASLQSSTPASIRGRIMSMFVWTFLGFLPFGSLFMGSIGRLVGAPLALATGALMLAAMAAVLYLRPHLLADVD